MEQQTRQEILTRDEAAAFGRYSLHGFLKLERAGKGPRRIRVGKKPLYHIDDLRAWLLSRVENPKHDEPVSQVVLLGSIMKHGQIPQPDGTFKQASVQERLDAATQLLKLLAPDVA